jgi:hypothetical protein
MGMLSSSMMQSWKLQDEQEVAFLLIKKEQVGTSCCFA